MKNAREDILFNFNFLRNTCSSQFAVSLDQEVVGPVAAAAVVVVAKVRDRQRLVHLFGGGQGALGKFINILKRNSNRQLL